MNPHQIGNQTIKKFIKARAQSLGFCLCGITSNDALAHFDLYQKWISDGYHGEMNYLSSERHVSSRENPTHFKPWVKSIISFAWPTPLNRSNSDSQGGQIAGYVGDVDYHQFIPQKLEELIQDLNEFLKIPFQAEIFCDSSPILERELAVRAGLGWIGRNSCVISPDFGSALLLAEIFLDLDLPIDPPFTKNFCGNCQKCINACPTSCILPNRMIDARRCISTLTIENKSLIPDLEFRNIGNRLFGCDICQSVCPWNNHVISQNEILAQMSEIEMIDMLLISDDQFNSRFLLSALRRAKRKGLVRNLCTVLANNQAVTALDSLELVMRNNADSDCRISAAKAIRMISPIHGVEIIQKVLLTELDPNSKIALQQLIKKDSLY
ncbi:MAG: tRNA epoxyqueuosine(34) reductase QueG [Anaerolineaceae bacterium]